MARSSRVEPILDATESLIRQRGYSDVAIRDVAERVGVRTAAVHYHFPTKAALVAAVTERYGARFFDALGVAEPGEGSQRMIASFRQALQTDGGMCLCGVLTAERPGLPEAVALAASDFITRVVQWLSVAYGDTHSEQTPSEGRDRALQATATLEGALLVARALGDRSVFDVATASLD